MVFLAALLSRCQACKTSHRRRHPFHLLLLGLLGGQGNIVSRLITVTIWL